MKSTGRMCAYCAKPVLHEERAALCERCLSVQHEDCWERNGRCSTFRCAGAPRTMVGADINIILEAALANANAEPVNCPFCANKVYAGVVQGRKAGTGPESGTGHGLLWVERAEDEKGIGRSLLRKLKKSKKWFLPGAHLKARSCGKCRRLFVWGVAVDDAFLKNMNTDNTERYCPHCSDELLNGIISLEPGKEGGARFECSDAPDFHKDWLGHAVLDRFFLNKWALPIQSIPAKSCEQCQYTEVAGRPVYRFQ